jgi:26S proteasome regulatory subunit T4
MSGSNNNPKPDGGDIPSLLRAYRTVLNDHHIQESRVREARLQLNKLRKEYDQTEQDLKALQSVGQMIGEVLRQLDEERFIVKASSGPRYLVGCRRQVDKSKLTAGTRVALDMYVFFPSHLSLPPIWSTFFSLV